MHRSIAYISEYCPTIGYHAALTKETEISLFLFQEDVAFVSPFSECHFAVRHVILLVEQG